MNRDILEFVTFCVCKLADRLHIPQSKLYVMFKDSGILDEYLIGAYDVLHTFGSEYLMNDLTDYLKEKNLLPR